MDEKKDAQAAIPEDPAASGVSGEVEVTATIHQELPAEVIDVLRKNNLRLRLDKVIAQKLFDQRPGLVAKDGCISSPSGPGC